MVSAATAASPHSLSREARQVISERADGSLMDSPLSHNYIYKADRVPMRDSRVAHGPVFSVSGKFQPLQDITECFFFFFKLRFMTTTRYFTFG